MALLDIVKKGSTSRSVTLRIIDSTDGTPETGVAFNTSGIDLWYRREGAAVTSITEVDLAALTTAWTSGGVKAMANGEYRLDVPDAAFATGVNYVDIGGTVTGMIVVGGRVRLVDFDPESTLGMQSRGTAAAIAAGTITLASGHGIAAAASVLICLTGGTDAKGKSRIGTYSGSGDVFNVSPAWNASGESTPSGTILYEVYPIPLGSTSAPPVVDVTKWNGTAVSTPSTAGIPEVNVKNVANQAASAAAGVTFPSSIASPTNITAGTITTVTNLTNAATAGDFTATMKTSIGTAVAASAVASVTGNVGGNVTGSVGSVVGAVGSVTGAVGSVTGNVGGNVTGSVGSIATGGITAASFAANAIAAAAVAAATNTAIAAAVLAAATSTPIAAEVKKVRGTAVNTGTGTTLDPWGP